MFVRQFGRVHSCGWNPGACEPNTPAGEAFLIPRGGKCTLQIGYQGMITLAARVGIEIVCADVIYENDVYSVARGSSPELVHEIPLGPGPGEGRWRTTAFTGRTPETLGSGVLSTEKVYAIRDRALAQLRAAGRKERGKSLGSARR